MVVGPGLVADLAAQAGMSSVFLYSRTSVVAETACEGETADTLASATGPPCSLVTCPEMLPVTPANTGHVEADNRNDAMIKTRISVDPAIFSSKKCCNRELKWNPSLPYRHSPRAVLGCPSYAVQIPASRVP